MYSPLELPQYHQADSRYRTNKQWSSRCNTATHSLKSTSKRTFNCLSHFMCRLPMLFIWTVLFIIVILHKLTSDISSGQVDNNVIIEPHSYTSVSSREFKRVSDDYLGENQIISTNEYVFDPRQFYNTSSDYVMNGERVTHGETSVNYDNFLGPTSVQEAQLSTFKKSPSSDYLRQNKVFILIIQDEVHESNLRTGRNKKRSSSLNRPSPSHIGTTFTGNNRRLRIPNHIKIVIQSLNSHRIGYDIETTSSGLPSKLLADEFGTRYSVIIIDNFLKYTKINRWVRDQLDRHCRANGIGVITYVKQNAEFNYANDDDVILNVSRSHMLAQRSIHPTTTIDTLTDQFPLFIKSISKHDCRNISSSSDCLTNYQLNEMTPILRVLKRRPNFILNGELASSLTPWSIMSSDHVTYEPVTWAKDTANGKQILVMRDLGQYDGIKRIMFGVSNEHWLNRILLLDSIEHLSGGKIISPMDRFIQIDIDDIFVGEKGTRMNVSDVEHLISTQKHFAKLIDGGFKFNLGYSGKYFKHGHENENLGDEMLVKRADEFTWFCHFWSHAKAHLFNDTQGIGIELKKNLQFARDNQLPIIGWGNALHLNQSVKPPTYAVAPHHSGVYPIHEPLYETWRQILNVQVTSTEEYPHLRPASGRQAFVHKTITVLPRQTCGLYTHTIFKSKYPGGFGKLLASIDGGELFETILHNPVNIYMTHMSNYANDRLAPFTFSRLFDFVRANTNLRIRYIPSGRQMVRTHRRASDLSNHNNDHDASPIDKVATGQLGPEQLAQYYFSLYPAERDPLWTNPCHDSRHLAIWSAKKHGLCSYLPSLLVVGPQKTGTTALFTFLKLNPSFRSSYSSPTDYEEVQFFNDKHYSKGVDWYFNRFYDDNIDNSSKKTQFESEHVIFDKSATYFDDPKVPLRASSLLPDAHILILLINPADRALSWYHHMKAHNDPVANQLKFEQLIDLDDSPAHQGEGQSNDNPLLLKNPLFRSETSAMAHVDSTSADSTFKFNSSFLAQARALRKRCLHPGYYAQHLLNWLDSFPSRQIIIIDGEWFKQNPAAVMNRLQLLLRVSRRLDYSDLLVYDENKGFFCYRSQEEHQSQKPHSKSLSVGGVRSRRHINHNLTGSESNITCLGSGKGRKYSPMSRKTRFLLDQHYRDHNRQLAKLLTDIGQPLPIWLDESLNKLMSGNQIH